MIIDREPFSTMTVPAGLHLGVLKPIIFFHWPKIQSYSQHGGDPVKPVNEPCFSQAQGELSSATSAKTSLLSWDTLWPEGPGSVVASPAMRF